jgi:hypothetical protein
MIEQIIVISLMITAIHVSMMNDMVFEKLKDKLSLLLDKMRLSWLKKPLYECNICMGGIWTLVIYPLTWGLSWKIIPVMLGVIGANVLIAAFIKYLFHEDH